MHLNRCVLIGRISREPELKYTASGTALCRFGLAVDRRVAKGADKETDFFDVTAWGKSGEFVANNLNKGRLIAVDGRIQIRDHTTDAGERRKFTDIIAEDVRVLEWPKDGAKTAAAVMADGDDFNDPFENQ